VRRQVVVTGTGLICPLGDTPATLHRALCEGRRPFGPPAVFTAEGLDGRVVAEVRDFEPVRYLGPRNLRPLDRTGRLAAVAAGAALESSGWTIERREATEAGLVLGTMFGSLRTIGEFDRRALRDGPEYVSPLDFANTVINAAAGQVAIWHRLRGPNSTIAAGASSGLQAVGYAAQLVRLGRASALLAGGAEEVCYETFLGCLRAGLLADSGEPLALPRPFHAAGSGWVLGEGAGFMMIEDEDHARARGAAVLAVIEGFGSAFDGRARGVGAAGEDGLRSAIDAALAEAGVPASALGFISASGSGHRTLDAVEADTLATLTRGSGPSIPVTAIKACTGEALGATGALQAIAAIEALRAGQVPGVPGVDALTDPRINLVPGGPPRPNAGSRALLTSLAPEGNCCALVLSVPPTATS